MNDVGITKAIEKRAEEAKAMLEQVPRTLIKTDEENAGAAKLLKEVKAKKKELDEDRKSMTKPLDQSKKRIMAFFKPAMDALGKAENMIREAMIAFQAEQEEKRQKEQRKLDEAARKKEEKERQKLEKKAEKAEAKGDTEKADELRQQQEQVHVEAPQAQGARKIDGLQIRKTYEAVVEDFAKLPDKYKLANMPMLNAEARNSKGTAQIPGVKIVEKKHTAIRRC
jgi:hypothetical protein